MDKSEIKAYIAWFLICIVWGTTFLAIRIGVESLPPMLFAGIRWIIAGPILFLFLIARGVKLPPKSELKHLMLIGVMLIGLANGFLVYAEQWIPSGLASLLITTMPFWIVGMESFLPSGPKFNKIFFVGLVIGFIGVATIFINDFENLFEPNYMFGILCILASILVWASGSVYAKHKRFESNPIMRASIQMITAGILQLLIGFLLGEHTKFSPSTNGYLAIGYLAVFGSLLGYVSYIYAISILPVAFVSTYTYINPVIALFLGWYFLDEKIGLPIIIGTIIIFIGVGLVQYSNRRDYKNRQRIPSQLSSLKN
ncbi:MAG: EamA family transporter [Ignavibacteriae bacterium]|nr:EamA family transporter [Ignavibacteriota bacterium]